MRQSTVLLIPGAQQALLNQYLESIGWGPNSLSVELSHVDGSRWFGSHIELGDEWLANITPPDAPIPINGDATDYAPALAALSIYHGECCPSDNFAQALSDNSLTKAEPDPMQ